MNKFAVIIQSYKREDRVYTYDVLRKQGYTGRIIILIDDTDDQRCGYIKRYGEQVIVFDKQDIAKRFDHYDNFGRIDSITCARNACFDIAKREGLDYFVEMDDDYTAFEYKIPIGEKLFAPKIKNLDYVFSLFVELMKSTNVLSVAFAQGGDFIGGANNNSMEKMLHRRKCMNTFFCATSRRFTFRGIMNEDVNTYTSLGRVGWLFFTHSMVSVVQKQTQSNEGGITELYKDSGTYVKSFYSILSSPSCIHIGMIGTTKPRIHHKIKWRYAVPKIINEKYKKGHKK